jgi:hypothetical protein
MQIKIIIHLSDPTHGIGSIKFIDLNVGNTWVTMKGVGMEFHSMGGINTIYLGGFFKEANFLGSIQQLGDTGIDDVKFDVKFVF